MENNVILSIQGIQIQEDEIAQPIELITEGRLARRGEQGYALSYLESELTGMEGTRTTFQIEEGRVTLLREGEVNSQMVFEEGLRHLSLYDTPYGSLEIGVHTRRMKVDLDKNGGQIEISYAIEINHAVTGENCFKIDVKRRDRALKQ